MRTDAARPAFGAQMLASKLQAFFTGVAAPVIGILGLGWMAPKIMMTKSIAAAQGAFWVYATLWGALIAPMFFMYTGESLSLIHI